jgi:hypothetical protein
MKMYTLLLVGLLLMIAIPDIYFYRHLKKKESKPVFFVLHFVPAAFFALLFLYMKFGLESARNFRVVAWVMWLVFSFLLIYIPKIIHILFFLLHIAYQKVFKRESVYFDVLRIITNIIVVVTLLISAFITPRSFDVTHVTISIPDLPKQFNGYRIVQLSDIHLGSWNHKFDRLKPVITLVNNQHPDIIVFTGDMVNIYAGDRTQTYYGSGGTETITGVLITIKKEAVTGTTIADITLAVCALFDLPAHKVAVLVKN